MFHQEGPRETSSPPYPTYDVVGFTAPDELLRAALFDQKISSARRQEFAGEDAPQPVVDVSEYARTIARDGKVKGLANHETGDLMAICMSAHQNDPEAEEILLQNMPDGMAYFMFAGVDDKYRRQGLGSVLVDIRLQEARKAGKTKAIASVHPTNVGSLRNLLKAGFIGVAALDNYYNMDSANGARIVMLNGNINDPNWAKEYTNNSRPLQIPYAGDFDTVTALALSVEYGYCMVNVERGADKSPVYTLAKFLSDDDKRLVPHMLYPYNSLTEAFRDKCGPRATSYRQRFADHMLHKGVGFIAEHFKIGSEAQYGAPSSPLAASRNRFFVKWASEYRRYVFDVLQGAEATGFVPSFQDAALLSGPNLVELIITFLAAENEVLKGTAADQRIEMPSLPNLDAPHIQAASAQYGGDQYVAAVALHTQQNPVLYKTLAAQLKATADGPPRGQLGGFLLRHLF